MLELDVLNMPFKMSSMGMHLHRSRFLHDDTHSFANEFPLFAELCVLTRWLTVKDQCNCIHWRTRIIMLRGPQSQNSAVLPQGTKKSCFEIKFISGWHWH